jgi:hypothetical protein
VTEEPQDVGSWSDLPPEERKAIRRAAQSQIWWAQLGKKVKGMGPFVTGILAALALWQILGECLREWLVK